MKKLIGTKKTQFLIFNQLIVLLSKISKITNFKSKIEKFENMFEKNNFTFPNFVFELTFFNFFFLKALVLNEQFNIQSHLILI